MRARQRGALGLLGLLLLAPPAGAGGGEPACAEDFPAVEGALQVAWVSPLRRRASAGARLEVVRVADLRAWLHEHPDEASEERVLQLLGLHGPHGGGPLAHRRWKVVIFDVLPGELCRPVEGGEGRELAGVPGCDEPLLPFERRAGACGWTRDRAAGGAPGLPLYRLRWRDGARRGFCVFPLSRFVEEG